MRNTQVLNSIVILKSTSSNSTLCFEHLDWFNCSSGVRKHITNKTTYKYQQYPLCILLMLDFCPHRITHLLPSDSLSEMHSYRWLCIIWVSAVSIFISRRLSVKNPALTAFFSIFKQCAAFLIQFTSLSQSIFLNFCLNYNASWIWMYVHVTKSFF